VGGRRLRLHPSAEHDINEGLAFYLRRSLKVASRFLDDVDAALALVKEAPERWPLYRLGTRRHIMTSFPYSLVYRVTEKEIQVYAVAHAKRRPLYWRARRL
jgi:plasmid stabilization system protein ParE